MGIYKKKRSGCIYFLITWYKVSVKARFIACTSSKITSRTEQKCYSAPCKTGQIMASSD